MDMNRDQYARLCEALRVTELTLHAPRHDADVDAWRETNGHVRIAASLHRSLGNFNGALKIMRWFRDSATVAGISHPELSDLAASSATTVWEWEAESAARHDKLVGLRMDLLDAEVRQNPHDVRAVRMQIADHEEQSGNFAEAAAQIDAVMKGLPADDASLGYLSERAADLDRRSELQHDLVQPPAYRPVLADDRFLAAPAREFTPSLG